MKPISAASLAGWKSYAARHGVSVTALVEAIGLYLARIDDLGSEDCSAWILDAAHEIAAARRRRMPPANDNAG